MGQVTTTYQGELLFETAMGRHHILADMPPEAGGSDRGPAGLELLAGALATCIAGTIQFYGNRIGLDTRDLKVTLDYEKVMNPMRITNLQVEITLPHADCREHAQTLLRVVERCPVRQTIANLGEIGVSITGADSAGE